MRIEPAGELRQRQPRSKSERHLAFVRSLPCCIRNCLRPAEAAHIRSPCLDRGKRPTGIAEKPDDRWTVPLCREHHVAQHAAGDELAWWAKQGRDPFAIAAALWTSSGESDAGKLIAEGRLPDPVPF